MKSIVLTEEQKKQLLEMANKLFPKYKFSFHHHDDGILTKDKSFDNYLPGFLFGWEICENGEYSEYYHDAKIFLHWFEFCMTHLLDKISLMYDDFAYKLVKESKINYLDGTIATGLQIGVIKGENPIDILYKYFKKLKQ